MKRDLDLYRRILMIAEQKLVPNGGPLTESDFGDVDPDTLVEHIRLMTEGELIDASWVRREVHQIRLHAVNRILNPGYDFLDAVRSDAVWSKTKKKVADTVGTASLEVVKAVAQGVARAALGM